MTAWPSRDASIGQTGSTTRASTRRGWLAAGAFVGAYTALYAASYPLTNWVEREAIHGLPTDPGSLMYAALAIVGLALALNGRGELAGRDWLLGLAFGGVVWISIQSRYWYNDWTPYVPYLDPTMHAGATRAMVVGATALLRRNPVLGFRLAQGRIRDGATALLGGTLLGLPFAIVNVLLLVGQGSSPGAADLPFAAVTALRPAVLEEVAYRLLFLAVALTVFRRHFSSAMAVTLAVGLSVTFHAAVHVPELLLTSPVSALVTAAVVGVVFGLPIALLAARRSIESAIGFHWVIDAVRFALGL
jgi:hypothetical protein